jgi:predicted house-cleaning noncanonical NTP pyrophosphatase (MazG superfamily)
MTEYFKLVRNGIPNQIKKNGEMPRILILSEQEFPVHLRDKLHEEATEVQKASVREYILKELADVREVFNTLLEFEVFGYLQLEHADYTPRILDVSHMHHIRAALVAQARHIKSLAVREDRKEPYAVFWRLYRETLGVYCFSLTEVEIAGEERRIKMGGFEKRIFLESVSYASGAAQ